MTDKKLYKYKTGKFTSSNFASNKAPTSTRSCSNNDDKVAASQKSRVSKIVETVNTTPLESCSSPTSTAIFFFFPFMPHKCCCFVQCLCQQPSTQINMNLYNVVRIFLQTFHGTLAPSNYTKIGSVFKPRYFVCI